MKINEPELKEYELSYAGLNSRTDLGFIIGRVSKPLAPTMNEVTQSIPGKYGNIYSGTNYESMVFNIPITILADDAEEYNMKIENIRNAFIDTYQDRNKEYPLIFGDRPEVTYYGHWTSLPEPTFVSERDWDVQATLQFTCSEPYGYMEQETVVLNASNSTFVPKGNTFTYPVYVMDLTKDVFNLGYVDNTSHAYVATGYTVDIDNTDEFGKKIDTKEPLTVNEPHTDLSQWTTDPVLTHSIDIDNGEIDGNMDTYGGWGIAPAKHQVEDKNNGTTVDAFDYGDATKHKNWYGPMAIHRNVNNPTNDWQIALTIRHQQQYTRAMGKLELYLLDRNNNRRGKIWIKDQANGSIPHLGIQLGDKTNNKEMLTKDPGVQSDDNSNDYVGPQTIPGSDKNFINTSDEVSYVTLTTIVKQKRYESDLTQEQVNSYNASVSAKQAAAYTAANQVQATGGNISAPMAQQIGADNTDNGVYDPNYVHPAAEAAPISYPMPEVKESTKVPRVELGTAKKLNKTKGYTTKKTTTKSTSKKSSKPLIVKLPKKATYTATKNDKNGVPMFTLNNGKAKKSSKKSTKRSVPSSLRDRIKKLGLDPDKLEFRYKTNKTGVNWQNQAQRNAYQREQYYKKRYGSKANYLKVVKQKVKKGGTSTKTRTKAKQPALHPILPTGYKQTAAQIKKSKRVYIPKEDPVLAEARKIKVPKIKSNKKPPKVIKYNSKGLYPDGSSVFGTGASDSIGGFGGGGGSDSGGTDMTGTNDYNADDYEKKTFIPSGDWIPVEQDTDNPDGTHWVYRDYTMNQLTEQLHQDEKSAWYYKNRNNVFSDFCGTLYLRKVGTHFSCWIQMRENKLDMPVGTVIGQRDFYDKDNNFDFALTSVAAWFAKSNIEEDKVDPPHPYDDTKLGVQSMQYWNIYDGGNTDPSEPQIIAQKGERIFIDTNTMKVYKSDGTDLTKYTSFASSFPPLKGGVLNRLSFTPTPGEDCDLFIEYRPRIK